MKAHTTFHRDGSIWAKGWLQGETMVGRWVWYRKDGTKMRAGSFKKGRQVGEWVTYDQQGRIVKKTHYKAIKL